MADWLHSELDDWLATYKGPMFGRWRLVNGLWKITYNFVTAATFTITKLFIGVEWFSNTGLTTMVGIDDILTGTVSDQVLEGEGPNPAPDPGFNPNTTYYYFVHVSPDPPNTTTKRVPHLYGSYSRIRTPPLP